MSAVGDRFFPGFQNSALVPTGVQGLVRTKRRIGPMVADVTVEEQHNDDMVITQHPVEKTADITDHAYPLPPTVVIHVGYSQSGSGYGGAFGDTPYQGDPVPLQTIYEQYLALQKGRELLEVQTGKRLYKDMLIRTIVVVTDPDTENALFLTVHLQNANLVSTQTVEVPSNSVQKNPQLTGNTVRAGTKSATTPPANYNSNGLAGQ